MMDDGLFENFQSNRLCSPQLAWPRCRKWPCDPDLLWQRLDTFKRKLKEGGHAALPHLASDTIQVAAQIVLAWQTIVSRNIKPTDPAVLSVTRMHGGEARAVIPKSVELGAPSGLF